MQVAITTRHGGISDAKRQYIHEKSEKLLTIFVRVTSIQVLIDFEKDRAKVELLVDTEHKHNFVAQEVGEDVIATFDVVLNKMEQQIRKYKEKIQDHRRDRPLNELTEIEQTAEESDSASVGS